MFRFFSRSSNIDYVRDEDDQFEYPVFSQSIAKDKVRKKSEAVFVELAERCDGVLCSFSGAIPQLVYFDKKNRRRMPWNCDLEIGQNFVIKIAAYIFVSETKHNSGIPFGSLSRFESVSSCAKRRRSEHGNLAAETGKRCSPKWSIFSTMNTSGPKI